MAQLMDKKPPQTPPQKPFPVSWDQFHRDARALAWRLSDAGPFSAIVCITRGGLVPAAIVARELGVRVIDTVCIASYDHTKQGELNVLKGISESTQKLGGGTGKWLLIVDDLVDTDSAEVSQDTRIFFPWDAALSFAPPLRDGAA